MFLKNERIVYIVADPAYSQGGHGKLRLHSARDGRVSRNVITTWWGHVEDGYKLPKGYTFAHDLKGVPLR